MDITGAIERLGRKRIIDRLGVTASHISNWLADGVFPAWWYDELDAMASEDGWEIPRALFSWKRRKDAA